VRYVPIINERGFDMTKIGFSIHSNKAGVTMTVPATRYTEFFQLCLCFWAWGAAIKGPAIVLLTPNRVEHLSALGYRDIRY